ncbi:MAG: hypothetical protein UY95_C0003G0001, partial [Parcubacteria group bacterium GW2011_GWA2_56_7]
GAPADIDGDGAPDQGNWAALWDAVSPPGDSFVLDNVVWNPSLTGYSLKADWDNTTAVLTPDGN